MRRTTPSTPRMFSNSRSSDTARQASKRYGVLLCMSGCLDVFAGRFDAAAEHASAAEISINDAADALTCEEVAFPYPRAKFFDRLGLLSDASFFSCISSAVLFVQRFHAINDVLMGHGLGRPRWLCLLPKHGPIDTGAKLFTGDFALGDALNSGAKLGGDRMAAVDPVPNVLLLQANGCGQSGLPAHQLNRPLKCFHGVNDTTIVFRKQNKCGLPITTGVVTLGRMALGARIREALGDKAQNSLSEESPGGIPGLTQQTLWQLIKRDSATSEFALRIADKLGVSLRWLLDGIGDKDAVDWPFPGIDRTRFDDLEKEQKIEIQGVVRERIESFEEHNLGKLTGT